MSPVCDPEYYENPLNPEQVYLYTKKENKAQENLVKAQKDLLQPPINQSDYLKYGQFIGKNALIEKYDQMYMGKPKGGKKQELDQIEKFEASLKIGQRDEVARPIVESITKTVKTARAQSRDLLFEASEKARIQR